MPTGKKLWQPLLLLTLQMQGCLEKGVAFGRSVDPGSVGDHKPAAMGKAMCQAVNGERRIPVLSWQCCLLPRPPWLKAEEMGGGVGWVHGTSDPLWSAPNFSWPFKVC